MSKDDIDALDRALAGGDLDEVADEEVHALAALASAIQATATTTAPRHADVLRQKLIDAAAAPPPSLLARLREGFASSASTVRYSLRAGALSAVAAVALTSGGMAIATERAVPGDAFYGVKTLLGDLRVDRADDGAPRGYALIESAETRIGEAEDAVERDRSASAALALELANADARAGAGALIRAYQDTDDTSHTDALTAFTADSRPRVVAIGEAVDDSAVDDLLVVLDRIDARLEAILGGGCCDDGEGGSGAPLRGGFQFDDIPDADLPFEACPCLPTSQTDVQPSGPSLGAAGSSSATASTAPAPSATNPTAATDADGSSDSPSSAPPTPLSDSGADSGSSSEPSQPAPSEQEPEPDESGPVSESVDGVKDPVDGVVDAIIEASPEPVAEPVGETAGTIDEVTGEVTGTIDEVVGGLSP